MLTIEYIKEIVNKEIADTKYFVVDLQLKSGSQIQLFVDAMEGVTIDECAQLSKQIESHLDRDVNDFELMVSSGGIDMPFKVLEQYQKHKGQEVEVLHKSGTKYNGILTKASQNAFELETKEKVKVEGKKRKVEQSKILEFEYDNVKSVKLIIRF